MDIISKILLGGKAYIKYIGRKDGDKMLFSELKCKDVINLRDCKKLGRVSDLEFDECSGKLCKSLSRQEINFVIYLILSRTIVFRTRISDKSDRTLLL